jgi:hypothetical protein
MQLSVLVSALAASPQLGSLSYLDMTTFIELVYLLKPTISRLQASYQDRPPENLSLNVHDFLMASLGLSHETAKQAWACHRALIWSLDFAREEEMALRIRHVKLFLEHGPQRRIGKHFCSIVRHIYANLA